ncbi:MAG: hypothetical protein ABI672_19220 [Vicinamibacteria bacterium]
MKTFLRVLEEQRWDDHRFYHHSRINQSLHLVSAMSFVCSYVLLFKWPVAAAMLGWLVAMVTRQAGHFFFEPKGYDEVNQATHVYKEAVKVGYNLQRKIILLALWALIPIVLVLRPDFFGAVDPHMDSSGFLRNLSFLWIALGMGAVVFRTVHLFFLKDVTSGLAWFTKILTDPFHDIKLYYKSPMYLMRGELIDPMNSVSSRGL